MNREQKECAETIRESGVILLDLVNDILDFARIAEGKVSLEEQAFRPLERLEECCDVMAARAAMKNLDFCLEVSPTFPEIIVGDAARFRQILLNLLVNAVKFTSAGSVVLRADHTLEAGEAWITMRIEDTGIGIRAEDREKLFKVFSQIDATSTREQGGSGLGLAISRDLAERMGGSVEVESVHGEGSIFTLRLPCCPAEVTALDGSSLQPPNLDGVRVALLDDSPRNAGMLERYLKRCGAEVDVFVSTSRFQLALEEGLKWTLVIAGTLMDEADETTFLRSLRDEWSDQFEKLFRWVVRGSMDAFVGLEECEGLFYKPVRYRELNELLATCSRTPPVVMPPKQKPPPVPGWILPLDSALLVVDDNAINLRVALRFLASMGFTNVDEATSGEAAEALASVKDYAIIFMDMQMPTIDGLEATRRIRRQTASGHHPGS